MLFCDLYFLMVSNLLHICEVIWYNYKNGRGMDMSQTIPIPIDIISSNVWDIFASVASIAAVIVTVVYVLLTHKLLKETIRARELQFKPHVIIDIELRGYVGMIIKNIGNDCALNICTTIEPQIDTVFSNIDFLAPGRERVTIFDYPSNINEENSKYKFNISYENSQGNKYKNEYYIDIAFLKNSYSNNTNSEKI